MLILVWYTTRFTVVYQVDRVIQRNRRHKKHMLGFPFPMGIFGEYAVLEITQSYPGPFSPIHPHSLSWGHPCPMCITILYMLNMGFVQGGKLLVYIFCVPPLGYTSQNVYQSLFRFYLDKDVSLKLNFYVFFRHFGSHAFLSGGKVLKKWTQAAERELILISDPSPSQPLYQTCLYQRFSDFAVIRSLVVCDSSFVYGHLYMA